MKKPNKAKLISAAALAVTMAAAMSVPAFAAAPDDLYVTDGNSTSYGNANISIDYSEAYQEEVNRSEAQESHVISYYMRTGDSGSLEFHYARVEGRSTMGGESVPGVTLPEGWYLDGYYIDGIKHTAGELASYRLTTPTLEVEVRTYPSGQNAGKDDRKETYTVTYKIRSGNKGDLVFEQVTVKGYGSTIPYADIPTLTSHFSKTYSISGYYVDGVKYSRSELAKLEITNDLDVEIRTYRDTGSDGYGWDENDAGYDWTLDLGNGVESYGYKACGCQYSCSHAYNYNFGGDIQYSIYGGLYAGGYYIPACGPQLPMAYPYTSSYATGYFNQCTVTYNPQNGEQCLTTSVWSGGRLLKPADPVCSGYEFLGWSTSKNGSTGYWRFDHNTANQNMVLYGIWRKSPSSTRGTTDINVAPQGYCKVTLKPNNGQRYDPVSVKKGNTISISGAPKCEDYTFVGWAKDKDGEILWDFENDKIYSDTTLYGVWKERSSRR